LTVSSLLSSIGTNLSSSGRHIIASLTALSVLLCNIICACGGGIPVAAAAGHTACHEEEQNHCSSHHRDQHDEADDHDQPSEPVPCHHDDGGSCQHCEAMMIAQGANDGPAVSFAPLFLDWAHQVVEAAQLQQFDSTLSVLDGIPPPRQSSSLLSLHCALTL
jgi:hypothetical protein